MAPFKDSEVWYKRRGDGKFEVGGRVVARLPPAERAHFESLGVPPAWKEVLVPRKPRKMLWAARDDAGRWQRRYNDACVAARESRKAARMSELTKGWWARLERRTRADMASADAWMPATAVRVMMETAFRPGWSRSANGHYGVTTLQRRHVRLTPAAAHFDFVGKSGQRNTGTVTHPRAVTNLRKLVRGKPHDAPLWEHDGVAMSANALKEYLADLGVRPKDFRTYAANKVVLEGLARAGAPDAVSERKAVLRGVYEQAAQALNNTPAICKKSYVHPAFHDMYTQQPERLLDIVRGARGDVVPATIAVLAKRKA